MNRKYFLSAVLSFFATIQLRGKQTMQGSAMFLADEHPVRLPDALQKDDWIGIVAPGGFITLEEVQPAIKKLEEWGYRVQPGSTIGKRDFTFGGTDEERVSDMQQMLDDPKIKAILCARGGYGAIRIIDKLQFKKFKQQPKWVIGFSDITVLHCHINTLQIASIHSKMCNSFPADWSAADTLQRASIESVQQCLSGQAIQYELAPSAHNKMGMASGELVGGNLKTIESLAGTASDLVTRHKILFVEDTGEYLYSIDRMFWNLKRTGKLGELKGLIIGGFKIKQDEVGEDFGKTLEQIVLEKVKEYDYPVCFDFPVGHQKHNMALVCGQTHRLHVSETKVQLYSL